MRVLFGLAVLVVIAKFAGLLARRCGQAAVLGELLAGIAIGNLLPLAFGMGGVEFMRTDETLQVLAEIGVLLLLFDVGLEADLRGLVRVGWSSLLVATVGVVVPFALGWGTAAILIPEASPIVHVFVGATLTATSVGITARVLQEFGLSTSKEGQIILGAAVLDDVFGLVILAVVSGMVGAGESELSSALATAPAIFGKAFLFLGVAALVGHYTYRPLLRGIGALNEHGLLLVVGLALCFLCACLAELIGLAGILGAFAAGFILDPYAQGVRTAAEERTLAELMKPLGTVFVPLFFVLTGMRVDLSVMADPAALGLGAALITVAIVGKLVSGLAVLTRGARKLVVAVGMVPRGEVGLVFAGLGTTLMVGGVPLLSKEVFAALILMVLVTTLVAPITLTKVLR